jgi:hypothetical protein
MKATCIGAVAFPASSFGAAAARPWVLAEADPRLIALETTGRRKH